MGFPSAPMGIGKPAFGWNEFVAVMYATMYPGRGAIVLCDAIIQLEWGFIAVSHGPE